MYEIAYPRRFRYYSTNIRKFVDSTAIFYSINPKYKIRSTRRGTNTYSHIEYEESVLRNHKLAKDYLEMISYYTKHAFIESMKPEDKLIIFAGSIKMCSHIADWLKKSYPDISVAKYTGEDDYTNLIEPAIRVTTIGSGGTAHDIPNLTTIIMTVSVDSVQSNLQSFGRLRYIPDKELKYLYTVNINEPKQMAYHRGRSKMLQDRALSYKVIQYHKELGN